MDTVVFHTVCDTGQALSSCLAVTQYLAIVLDTGKLCFPSDRDDNWPVGIGHFFVIAKLRIDVPCIVINNRNDGSLTRNLIVVCENRLRRQMSHGHVASVV